ncbi:MAG: NADH-quinone oxidoreductase subunit M [Chloroflexota bacterium]|nr:MAG: NADH-quinone oxidoreductase subunit M [Chloroflexota bacterium]
MSLPLLSIIVFLPVLGALAVLLMPKEDLTKIKVTALIFTVIDLVLSLVLFAGFVTGNQEIQFVERLSWIPQLGIQYYLGVDGLSLPMVILTTLIGFVAVLGSWKISNRTKEYFALLLLLQMGVLGVFTALDFFLFFLFWEVELLPMYLLIGMWGGVNREYAAIKFLIYTILGSAFMMVGILTLYLTSGLGTFDMVVLGQSDLGGIAEWMRTLIFLMLFFGFAIKLPMFPFHTWLPDAHVQAPTAISVILAGVLLKMGAYGLLRINVTIFPDITTNLAPFIASIAVVNILYGAACCMVQKDMKSMIAYSSVSHMGYVLLGLSALNAIGLGGAALQMFTHGTITALLFLLVGLVYDKAHTRMIPDLGGLARQMPLVAVVFVFAGLASLGLPLLSGFVAEFLVFVGTFPVWQIQTILAAGGIVITAGYLLWMLQRVFFGPRLAKWDHLTDASFLEAVPLVILMITIVAVGVYPTIIMDSINSGVMTLLARLGA